MSYPVSCALTKEAVRLKRPKATHIINGCNMVEVCFFQVSHCEEPSLSDVWKQLMMVLLLHPMESSATEERESGRRSTTVRVLYYVRFPIISLPTFR